MLLPLGSCGLLLVTHHHFDHIAGIPELRTLLGDGLTVGLHPDAVPLLPPSMLESVKVLPLNDGTLLHIPHHRPIHSSGRGNEKPTRCWQVIHTPGHTASHIMLWDPVFGTLLAGDHVVGRGSSVLDDSAGGSMIDFVRTTRMLLALSPRLIIPAHGDPCVTPSRLLSDYLEHRRAREEAILSFCKAQATDDPQQIVAHVYAAVPESLWPSAVKNIRLHLDKLRFEGRL